MEGRGTVTAFLKRVRVATGEARRAKGAPGDSGCALKELMLASSAGDQGDSRQPQASPSGSHRQSDAMCSIVRYFGFPAGRALSLTAQTIPPGPGSTPAVISLKEIEQLFLHTIVACFHLALSMT